MTVMDSPPLDYALCARCGHDIDEHSAMGCCWKVGEVAYGRAACDCRGFVLAELPERES